MENFSQLSSSDQSRTARLFTALGNPVRLNIIFVLSTGEKEVNVIASSLDMKISNVSRHLSVLRKSGAVLSRKIGLYVYYRINLPLIGQILNNFREDIGRVHI